jgi:hypothetical protein
VPYRLELRLASDDVGSRVVIRMSRPAAGGRDEIADVLGVLTRADGDAFTVRKSDGQEVTVPRGRVLGGKVIPPPPPRP